MKSARRKDAVWKKIRLRKLTQAEFTAWLGKRCAIAQTAAQPSSRAAAIVPPVEGCSKLRFVLCIWDMLPEYTVPRWQTNSSKRLKHQKIPRQHDAEFLYDRPPKQSGFAFTMIYSFSSLEYIILLPT